MALFSIITPTYNRAGYLKNLIDSILNQSFNNFEWIIVDDASTDNTQSIVQAECLDTRIRYYKLERNNGAPAYPRNYGIARSKGDWICFLDSDDLGEKNKLGEIHGVIEKNPQSTVFCHDEIMIERSSGKKRYLRYGPYTSNFYENLLLNGNKLSTSATVVERNFLLKNDIKFNEDYRYRIVEDYDYWLQLAKHNAHFYFHREPLGYYLVDNSGISADHEKSLTNLSHLLKDHINLLDVPSANKNKILSRIEFSIKLSRTFFNLKSRHYRKFIYEIIFLFIESPNLFFLEIQKKLRWY